MPSLILKSYEVLLQQMINVIVARTNPGLNDITDSSVFKHLLAAPAREMDEIYYQLGLIPDLFSIDTATGEDLDRRALEIQPALIARRQATKSTGTLVFARAGTVGTVIIPAGTIIKASVGGQEFTTLIDGSITSGNTTSSATSAVAKVAGFAGNVAIGAVDLFDSKPSGVDTVTNPSTFIGGLDTETDDAFRNRIKLYISTLPRCTPEALEFLAVGVTATNGQRVAFAHVVEDMVFRGEVYLYLDDGSGTISQTTQVSLEVLTEGLGGGVLGNGALGGEEFLYTNFKPLVFDPINPALSIVVQCSGGPVRGVAGTLTYGTDFLLNDPAGEVKIIFTPPLVAGEEVTCTYTYYGGLIQQVQKLVDGDPLDRINFPGWRAAGVRVHVLPPQVLLQLVSANVLVQEGYVKGSWNGSAFVPVGCVLAQVAEAISAYINNLGVSGDVIRSEIITRIMEVPGVVNTSVTLPASDIILLDDQLPRTSISTITLS